MTTSQELMARFAERTGLTGTRPQRRYLWTDAFAVCNFLGLGQDDRATALVAAVHRELGRHRADDTRRGWISGLPEADGAAHPTFGGLRIGKPLQERGAAEPFDEQLEWERDGQYFHYLTKWMHALDRAGMTPWARELADVAYRRFVYQARGGQRMYWKMSIDLMRPQVSSMGHHDPLDGYVTALQLDRGTGELADAIEDYRAMLDPHALATGDPLGIGGLLVDAYRLTQLDRDRPLREALLEAARVGLDHYLRQPDLQLSAERRLAFRELGLAIGLAAVEAMAAPGFTRFAHLREAITRFWLDDAHRSSRTYRGHEDISDVMLATCLAPDGYLVLRQAASRLA
ncbi:MAG TPA: hypothetical protein VIV58_04585 [Kofleriaceae bacterium]